MNRRKESILYITAVLTVFAAGMQTGGAQSARTADTMRVDHAVYKMRVVNYSREIMQSLVQKRAMQQAMLYAKTNYLPRLDFTGSAQYRINQYDLDLMGAAVSMPHETYNLGLQLSQVVYNGGAVKNNYRAAIIQDRIAGETQELTLQNVSYAAEVNYWSTVAKKKLYLTMCEYVNIIASLADVLKTRFDDGLIAKTDYLQITSRLKEAQMNRSEAYKSYQLALQNLNVMMGREPLVPVDPVDSIDLALKDPARIPLEQALVRRPDYSIAELKIRYQKKQVNLVKSQFNPQFSVGLQQTWGTQMLNFNGSTMFNTNAVASLNIPIFSWGARYRKVNSQRAQVENAMLDRQIALDNISREVANTWTEYIENTKQIALAWDATVIAAENLEINTFSYNEGKLTILDVLSSQLTWIQAQSTYITTLLQQKVSRAAYLKAIGTIR